MARETAASAGAYAQRLLDNDYVQENLANAMEGLRSAYARASKRRVKPAQDKKVRQQVRQAALSVTEAAQALKSGRTKPKRKRGRQILLVIGLGAVGSVAGVVVSEELRKKLLGSDDGDALSDGQPTSASPKAVPEP